MLAQDSKLKEVSEVTYLGTIITSDGSNDKDIQERWNKGMGIISSVMSLIDHISLGSHYFRIGLLFRETNVINGIMTCVEVLHGLTKTQIEKLKNVDEIYLRKLLGAHSKTPIEALYIETGKIPIHIIIKMRRLMYWWHLVNTKEDSMLHKFYNAQKLNPVKGDWVNDLDKDKIEFEIEYDDEEFKGMFKTKNTFKRFLRKKGTQIAEKYLKQLKAKHSKLDNVELEKLNCAPYLHDTRLSHKEVRLLFKLRTRMYQVKSNFKNQYNFNLSCVLCRSAVCDQQHLLSCKVIQSLVPEAKTTKVKYQHLFGSIDQMVPAAKLFMKITQQREELLQILENKNRGGQ